MAAIQKPMCSLASFVILSLLVILGVLDVSSANCVENPVEVCRRIGFTSVSLSRLFDAGASLDEVDATIQRLLPATESGCSENILPLICGAYLPLCDQGTEERRAPCKDTCRGIMSRECKGFLRDLGFKSEPAFSCADYPSRRRENCFSDLSVFRESAVTSSARPEPAVVFTLERMSPSEGNVVFEAPAGSDGIAAEYEVTYFSFGGGDGGTIVSNASSIPLDLTSPESRYSVLVRLQRNGTGASSYEEALLGLFAYDHCEELTVPDCASIGYTHAQFPNSFGHVNLEGATNDLQAALDLSTQQCQESEGAVKGFFCSLLAPQCTSNPDGMPEIIPPCRELCQAAQQSCADLDTGDRSMDCGTLPSSFTEEDRCYNHSSELALSPSNGQNVGRMGDTMVTFCSGGRTGGRPQWLKPSQRPVTDDSSRNIYTTNIGTRTSVLNIRSLNEGSVGEYTCVIGDVRMPMTIFLDTSEVHTATIGEGESYSFASPDHPGTYGENLNVTWLITIEEGCRLLINFETTDMDFGDVISIGSGTNTSAERLWYVAGTAGPSYLEINSTTTWLQFRSNRYTSTTINYSGFRGTMQAVCGSPGGLGTEAQVDKRGSGINMEDGDVYHIASPNYPRNYPKDAHVVWVFNLPENCALNVTFLDFHTDGGSFGEVRVGAGIYTAVSRGSFYGDQLPDPVSVEDTRVYVFFESNQFRTYKGFRAVTRAQCPQATTQHPTSINPEEVMTLQSDGSPLYLTSPNFPNSYPANADERWYVQAPAGCGITFHFEELNTERELDAIFIGDAAAEGDFRSTARKFSGNPWNLDDFTLQVERARVDFISDRSINRGGFNLEMRAQCDSGSVTTITAMRPTIMTTEDPGGIIVRLAADGTPSSITSPNYPNNYEDLTEETWIVRSPGNCDVRVIFNDFHTEQRFDKLFISDEGTIDNFLDSARLYTGDVSPDDLLLSPSHTVWIRFSSDFSSSEKGFDLSVQAENCRPEGYTETPTTTSNPHGTVVRLQPTGQPEHITSPNYPSNYESNTHLTWIVREPMGCDVRVVFNDFRTENRYDFLYIGDEGTVETFQSTAREFSGGAIPADYVLQTPDTVWVRFISDTSSTSRGFNVSLQATNCPTQVSALMCARCSMMSYLSPGISLPPSGSCEDADLLAEPCSETGGCYTVDVNMLLTHETQGNVMVRLRQKGCSESDMPKNTCQGPSSAAYQQILSELQGNLAQSTSGFEPVVSGVTGGICTCDTGDHCNANLTTEAVGGAGAGTEAMPEQDQTPSPSVPDGGTMRCSTCTDSHSSSTLVPMPDHVCGGTELQSVECTNGCMNTTVTINMSSEQLRLVEGVADFTITQVTRGCAEPDTEENLCYGPGDPRFDTVSSALKEGVQGNFPRNLFFTVEGISGSICTCDTADNCNDGPVVPQLNIPTPEPGEPEPEPGPEPGPEPEPTLEYSGDGVLHCSECTELTSSHPSIPLPGGNCGEGGRTAQDCTFVGSCGNMTVTILVTHETFGEMTITQRTRGCAEPLLSERNVCYGPGDAPFDAITAAAQESFGPTLTNAGLSYQGISGSMCSCDTGDYCNLPGRDQTSPIEPVTVTAVASVESSVLSLKPRPSSVEERGLVQFFRGWADVQGQGAPNDFCRLVRTDGKPFLSCHLAGSEGQDVMAYTSPDPSVEWFDPGYSNTWYMKDEDGDGRDDYCRCVGSVPNTLVVCMKAGMNGFEGPDQEFTPAGAPRDCFYLTADPFFGFP